MKNLIAHLKEDWYKYVLEIIVITIGILGAFALNSWNDGRKVAAAQQELINSLIEDFEYNTDVLLNEKLVLSEERLTNMNLFYHLIENETQIVSVDSLRTLARTFFRFNEFTPNLTAYNTAQSTGSLGLLKNKKLMSEFTLFIETYDLSRLITEANGVSFWNGSSWEFRKTVQPGMIYNSIYSGSLEFETNYAEYQQIMGTPLARNALQNAYILEGNNSEKLKLMHQYSVNILELLKEMRD